MNPERDSIGAHRPENAKNIGLKSRTCAECGKQFHTSWAYVYKRRDKTGRYSKWYCGYTCYRAQEPQEKKLRGAGLYSKMPKIEEEKTPEEIAREARAACEAEIIGREQKLMELEAEKKAWKSKDKQAWERLLRKINYQKRKLEAARKRLVAMN